MPSGHFNQVFTRSSELGQDLKEKITLKCGIDINQIRLVYHTRELQDVSGLSLLFIIPLY